MTAYLANYQVFKGKQELNFHVSQHEKHNRDQLTATNRAIFRFIARYSVKYAGASHLKFSTIAEALGRSERTIGRTLKKLEALSMLRRINTTRPKSGGRGASVIQILPYVSEPLTEGEVSEKACDNNDEQGKTENEPLRKQINPNSRTRDGEDKTEDNKRALKTAIPKAIYDKLAPFFNASNLYEVYGILLRAKASVKRSVRLEDYTETYIDDFYNVIRKYKAGEVHSFKGLLYSAWERTTSEICRDSGDIGLFAEVLNAAEA